MHQSSQPWQRPCMGHAWLSGTSSPGIWESQVGFSIAGRHRDRRHASTREAIRRNKRLNVMCRCFSYVDFGDTCILKMLTGRLIGQLIRITTCVVQPVLALWRCISFPCFIICKRPSSYESSLDTAPVTSRVAVIDAFFRPFAGDTFEACRPILLDALQLLGKCIWHHHVTLIAWEGLTRLHARSITTTLDMKANHVQNPDEEQGMVFRRAQRTVIRHPHPGATLIRRASRNLRISMVHMPACHRQTLKPWKAPYLWGNASDASKFPWFTCLHVTVRHWKLKNTTLSGGLQERENFHGLHVWMSPSDTKTLKNPNSCVRLWQVKRRSTP